MTETPDTRVDSDRRELSTSTDGPAGPDPSRIENPVASQHENAPLSLEDVFGILRNERRQHVLSYLLITDDEPVQLGHLAEHIAAIENDKPIKALDSQERKRVYVAL
ncbi:DUF7344 domain-containing protein [Halorubrum lacusprofundi]|jgi:hypothetical protein|uniref:DUF7344 domain-containing protein n=1 Tax=Halorubrum lacusprofundi (strain ATCC 49239 / DSM 5036 / JCM 8891 / ACAM 34) TaxID=416348 RepID=B9LX08_HALLT|nr:hypothetical protein [Halorubrum lacusprofundi]ACM58999.1 conserved hypothetical protein [Halorubrum lacusprofundi ATCC 49239]MCG1007630.1 hypothetical protein [Halorubrum lacusprofundi]